MYNENKKTGHIILYASMVVVLIGIFSASMWYRNSSKPISSKSNETIDLEIPTGSSTSNIGKILQDKDLIRNKWAFLVKTKMLNDGGSLKAGNYQMNKSMDLGKIVNVLIEGGKSNNTISFTIPEGYEIKDVAKKLEKEGILNSEKFIKLSEDKEKFEKKFVFLQDIEEGQSLEGFLFPSTYEIYESHTEEDIINKMLEGFEKVYDRDIKTNLKDMDLNLNEIITLASIVEREAKLDKERTIISAVFHNRLKTNMNLQSCATVQYILGERKEVLSNAETRIDSPFNTYVNNGLPPSPIASPGEQSLIAAINPDDVEYLFFRLTGDDGSHTFTKTYEEHLSAGPKK